MVDFSVFILTHGRADNVITYKTLRNQGYTGKIYLIIDKDDPTKEVYFKNFSSDEIIVFDKKEIKEKFDMMDNFGRTNCVVYARNACWDIAKSLGIKNFLELDDDYTSFDFKIIKNALH